MKTKEYANRIYNIYNGMRRRCSRKNDSSYKYYGGKGIKICDEWLNSFKKFKQWSLENGYQNDLSIDRIDNDGNYCPENCRWVDNHIQSRNKSNNISVTYNGITKCMADLAQDQLCKVEEQTFKSRIHLGWSFEDALLTPKNTIASSKNISYNGTTKSLLQWSRDPICEVSYGELLNRIASGQDIASSFLKRKSKNFENVTKISYNGISKTISNWSEDPICKVTADILRSRIKIGWDIEEALFTPKINKKFDYNGESKLISEWHKDPRCIVTFGTLTSRIKYGWDILEALITPPRKTSFTYNNITKSLPEWSKDPLCLVSYRTLKSRMFNNWSLEEALKTPLIDNKNKKKPRK